jgi:hypothetical protein
VTGRNTAGGPALQAIVTGNTVAPLKVNSSAKVANLNADQLDGVDSMGFIQGKGTSSSAVLIHSADNVDQTLLALPGLGSFIVTCIPGSPIMAQVAVRNSGSTPLDVVGKSSNASGLGAFGAVLSPSDTLSNLAAAETSASAAGLDIWQLSPESGTNRVATVITTEMFDGSNCVMRATVLQDG